jgi:putative hydrolase of the HAD superfamily
MRIKCVLFNIEDTLYDATMQINMARLNSIKAMIEAGLPADLQNTYDSLEEIVKEYGPNYNRHFDRLLERLGLKWNPRVIAAGVIAYRETSAAYLKPYPDTVPVLLKLRESSYTLGAISEGLAVKQWQKLTQLGIQHLFHHLITSEEIGEDRVTIKLFKKILSQLKVTPKETLFVGNKLDTDISSANQLSIVSARIRKGKFKTEEPSSPNMTPKYEISRLSELIQILEETK